MKLTIDRGALLKSLSHVQNVVERRNTIPILSNVLINATGNHMGLTATDLDLTVEEQVAAQVSAPGALTVGAHTLYDIVRKLPDGAETELQASADGAQLVLRAGRSRFSLSTLPKDDFPQVGAGELPHHFTLASEDLKNLIDRTRFAISTEETRYYLNGIYLHAYKTGKQPVLRAVATDGHRLARFEMPLPDGAVEMPGVIVPRKLVAELRKLLDEAEGDVAISVSDTRIRLGFNGIVLTSKLIDGNFPDYQRVIPTANDKIVEIDRKEFRDAVDRVSTISNEKSRAIKLNLKSGAIALSATSIDQGSALEEMEIKYEGPDIEVGFNSKYLLDIAEQIDGEGMQMVLADAVAPALIRDLADASALYVLMPMRV
ncbi:MAG TPA: DNA polymerase III subunit beta [Dongiaceae bacterium]|jgi:DNA polymerase-3 subunit beta|nr:DNA polymerase III subunit beta [Dongiaceae bacterium]